LTFTWRVVSSTGITVATLAGADATWNTGGHAPGVYLAYLDVSNTAGVATSAPVPITLLRPPLDFRDGFETGLGAWSDVVP
jgi:hypothetical protein